MPLHLRTSDCLLRSATPATKVRLESLMTPHATAWLACTPLVKVLSPDESVAAMRRSLGLKLRLHPYPCPDCGCLADPNGLHAVTCLRSGFITRGHNVLRNTAIELFRRAGVTAEAERNLPGRTERPADMLVWNWQGKSSAIDFTLVTPDRPSAHHACGAVVMDSAARCKERKSADLWTAAGWDFLPFVGDTYGALRTDARNFVSSFISRYAAKFEPLTVMKAARAIWSTVSAATVARSAMQLSRLATIDKPFGSDVHSLDLLTARSAQTAHASVSASHPASPSVNMGIEPPLLPSLSIGNGGGVAWTALWRIWRSAHLVPAEPFGRLCARRQQVVTLSLFISTVYQARLQQLHGLLGTAPHQAVHSRCTTPR